MQALILAGGIGTRMGSLTKKIPKPMLEIRGRPLLEYTLSAIKDFVDEIIILVGYKGEQISSYFGNNFEGIDIVYVQQKKQLGTGNAVLCAEKYLHGKFIFIHGDDFFTKKVFQSVITHELCVVAAEVDEPSRFGVFEVENNIVVGLEEKPTKPKSHLANTSCWLLDMRIFEFIKQQRLSPRGEYEFTDALKSLIKTSKVYCEIVNDGWIPIAYPEDLNKVEKFLEG